MLTIVLAAALTSPHGTLDASRGAILQTVAQRQGASAHVERIAVHGNYALAGGRLSSAPFIDGLHRSQSAWKIVCTMRSQPMPTQLVSRCRFPQSIAVVLSADDATETAAERGDFGLATIAQVRAYNWSAKGPDREQERARLQQLRLLNEQMRTGMLTRAQAIQKWNQFRYSWALP